MKGRWVGIGAAVAVGLLSIGLVAHVYVTAYGTGSAEAERPAALKAARDTQARVAGTLWVAAYTPNAGEHGPSNTGHACFGRTVLVRMVWWKAGFDYGGGIGGPTDSPRALLLTADATSGTVCLVTAEYGPTAADLPTDAIYLYGPRKDLVPRPR